MVQVALVSGALVLVQTAVLAAHWVSSRGAAVEQCVGGHPGTSLVLRVVYLIPAEH